MVKLELISVGKFYEPTQYANNTILGLLLKVMVGLRIDFTCFMGTKKTAPYLGAAGG
ncbi:MAG: hypothetical protein IJV81_02760 [Paludibacteraceae bacterium]|nr:hypothetical protein [Paludibacteraceae bacterium]